MAAHDPPFNPLTEGIDDLIERSRGCWLWGEVSVEMQALATLVGRAGELLQPLHQPTVADWASDAAIGIVRTMLSIHQYAERYGSFADVARRLIPSSDRLTDAQVYALLAIAEARTSAEGYCDLTTGIEEELARNAIGPDEDDEIAWLRGEIAQWEREQWRWSDAMRESAERFLLLAQFAASTTAGQSDALRQAERQVMELNQRVGELASTVESFRGGRPKGAYAPLTRALMVVVRDAGSRDLEAVLALIKEYLEEDIEGVRFDGVTDTEVQYTDLSKNKVTQIGIDSLRRKLADLPAV